MNDRARIARRGHPAPHETIMQGALPIAVLPAQAFYSRSCRVVSPSMTAVCQKGYGFIARTAAARSLDVTPDQDQLAPTFWPSFANNSPRAAVPFFPDAL